MKRALLVGIDYYEKLPPRRRSSFSKPLRPPVGDQTTALGLSTCTDDA